MTDADRFKWDKKYAGAHWSREREPFPVVMRYTTRSKNGLALDLACGMGQHTVWLARQGYRTIGVDISRVALARAASSAVEAGVDKKILFVEADLERFPIPAGRFDLICAVRYLNRRLIPDIIAGLKPGGQLIYVTLNKHWLDYQPQANPKRLLQPGELVRLFHPLELVHYEEEAGLSALVAAQPAQTSSPG